MTRSRIQRIGLLTAALVSSFLLTSCSLEHHRELANGRDGGGYPTDWRWLTLSSTNKPLNGFTFRSEPLQNPPKGFGREALVDPGGPVGEVEHGGAEHH